MWLMYWPDSWKVKLRGDGVKTTEIRDRLQGIANYVDEWVNEKGVTEIEEGSFEEECLSKDLRNLIFEIKYKD